MFDFGCRRARSFAKRSVATLLFTTLASAGLVAATVNTASATPKPPSSVATSQFVSTESLATGVDAGCTLQALPMPHAHCHVGFQPGNTLFFAKAAAAKVAAHVTPADIISFVASFICQPLHLTGVLGVLCQAIVGVYFLNVFGTLQDAANIHQCFGFQTDITPGRLFYSPSPYRYGGAHWVHPVVFNGDPYAVWSRYDSCAVNISDPSSRYHFSRACSQNITDRWSYYPSTYRLNYDGMSCWQWFYGVVRRRNTLQGP